MTTEKGSTQRLSFRDILNPMSEGEASYFNVAFDEATCQNNNVIHSSVIRGHKADTNTPRYLNWRENYPLFEEKLSSRNDSHSHRDLQHPGIMTNSHCQISSSEMTLKSKPLTHSNHNEATTTNTLRPLQQSLPQDSQKYYSYLPTYYCSQQALTINHHQSSIDDQVYHRLDCVDCLDHTNRPHGSLSHLNNLDHTNNLDHQDNLNDHQNTNGTIKSDGGIRPPVWHEENPSTVPRTCANCGTYKTPSWRRCSAQNIILCNACGLYYNEHKRHRPFRTNLDGRTRAVRFTKYKLIDGEECPECMTRVTGDSRPVGGLKQICGTCNYLRFQRLGETMSRN